MAKRLTGLEIRQLRRSLDLTQLQLAQVHGVTQASISQIECGTRNGELRDKVEATLRQMKAEWVQARRLAKAQAQQKAAA